MKPTWLDWPPYVPIWPPILHLSPIANPDVETSAAKWSCGPIQNIGRQRQNQVAWPDPPGPIRLARSAWPDLVPEHISG